MPQFSNITKKAKQRLGAALGVSIALGALGACEGPATQLVGPQPDASPVSTPIGDGSASQPGAYVAWDDPRAIKWLIDKCASCHGFDGEGKQTPYYSAWPMARALTRESLETSDYTAAAYQTIVNRLVPGAKGPPSPMPIEPPRSPQDEADLRGILDWFNRRVPYSVLDAEKRYGTSAAEQRTIAAGFRCAKTATLRRFLEGVTLGAFDRVATPQELEYFAPAELDQPVTAQQREHIAAWFENATPGAVPAWKQETLDVALKKLANAIGGAPLIQPIYGLSAAEAAALKQEFYQLLRAKYDQWDYPQYFTSDAVMVSADTAASYGCPVPASGFAECAMQAPRQTFFATRGFLSSKTSSFMLENNNYGRVARVFFTLYGEALLAATDGPTGDSIPPLPDCLEGTDTRTFNNAPRGAAQVALYGTVCQGCHVARGLAAGSILFRPFARTGAVYTNFGTPTMPDRDLYEEIVAADTLWKFTPQGATAPVVMTGAAGEQFLASLLGAAAAPKSCLMTGPSSNPRVQVNNLRDLVGEFLKRDTAVARGFTRHAQRALMNQNGVTLELGLRAIDSYEKGKRKLPDLLKAYFLAETLACEP